MSPGARLDSHEGDQAEILSIPERISMLEKFKEVNESQSNDTDSDHNDKPFNIMKISQKLRESKLEEKVTPRGQDSGYKSARDQYKNTGIFRH